MSNTIRKVSKNDRKVINAIENIIAINNSVMASGSKDETLANDLASAIERLYSLDSELAEQYVDKRDWETKSLNRFLIKAKRFILDGRPKIDYAKEIGRALKLAQQKRF